MTTCTALLSGTALWILTLTLGVQTAFAAEFSVDAPVDAIDALPGDGSCLTAGGACSLRAAIQEANELPGLDTISISAGTYRLTIEGRTEDGCATGDLDVSDPVIIQGASATSTIVDGNGIDRVFDLGADTTLRRLTIRNGAAVAETGGGVRATPFGDPMTATIEDTIFTGNDALNGGGIANEDDSTLVLVRSTLTDNGADTTGGAINNSVFSTNAILENVTISGNFDANGGDAIRNEGTFTARHVTIVGDRIRDDAASPSVTLIACLLDNGAAGSCTVGTSPLSGGDNLERGTSCDLGDSSDRSGLDPMLLPLADHGGETPTHALPASSPAVDAIATCTLAEDQRGIARPQDGDASGGSACDVGAFEREPGFATTTTVSTTTTSTTIPICLTEPTFTSTACRIGALGLRFGGAAEPVKLATKLSGLLAKSAGRLPLAEDAIDLGQTKKAKRQVAKAAKLVRKFGKKLGGRKGPKVLTDETTRTALVADAVALDADLLLLRDAIE